MSDWDNPKPGTISWTDLTVEDAEQIRDFYSKVVGWEPTPVDMGGYADFNMNQPGTDNPVAGVCHSRGSNVGLPAQWLIYIVVEDLDSSAESCTELGGEVLVEPKRMGGHGRYCVIKDPAGAVAALFEPASAAGD